MLACVFIIVIMYICILFIYSRNFIFIAFICRLNIRIRLQSEADCERASGGEAGRKFRDARDALEHTSEARYSA